VKRSFHSYRSEGANTSYDDFPRELVKAMTCSWNYNSCEIRHLRVLAERSCHIYQHTTVRIWHAEVTYPAEHAQWRNSLFTHFYNQYR